MGWSTNSGRTTGWNGAPLTESEAKFYELRESGYDGWIDQDGNAVSDDEHQRWCDERRNRK